MALKTVNTDRCIGMAAIAEMFLAIVPWCIGCITDVTVDAFHQAVLFCADAFMHGGITLIENVLHVIGAYIRNRFNAGLFLAEASLGLGNVETRGTLVSACISCNAGCVNTQQQADYQSNETVFNHESMIRR